MLATTPSRTRWTALALTVTTVELTLTTAYVHLSLGGVLFTLNAIGYAMLALALVAGTIPHPLVRRFSWLPRVGLALFTAVTIGAYLVIGPYFSLGWVAKAVEVAILTLLAADVLRVYGSLGGLVRAATDTFRRDDSRPMQTA
ncbi:MAG TPA: hypothetical protein VEW95_00140 [Candidatus Limnocylindrales bacterium]|nr:hypothetical protein [Candidatus Limnocylindrales bacterium]